MEENTVMQTTPFAGFFKRGFSALIDFILISIFALIFNLSFSVSASWNYTSEAGLISTIIYQNPLNALYFIFVAIVYFVVMEILMGASIGKFVLKIRVVGVSQEKKSPSTILLKYIFLPIDLVFGQIFFLLSTKNQTLGDRIANTVVINKKLSNVSIVDKPVSRTRKILATLLSISYVVFFILILLSLPQITHFNEISRNTVGNIITSSKSDTRGLYDSFASEFKESFTFEEFEKSVNSPDFQGILDNLEVSKIVFYTWQFTDKMAVIIGKQNDYLVRLTFTKSEIGEWKLQGMRLVTIP